MNGVSEQHRHVVDQAPPLVNAVLGLKESRFSSYLPSLLQSLSQVCIGWKMMFHKHTPPSFQTILAVEGMMCQNSCGSTVKRALECVKGVISADVSYPKKRAIVTGSALLHDLIEAVDAVGFEASEYLNDVDDQSDTDTFNTSFEAEPDHQIYISNMRERFTDPSKIKDIIKTVDGVLDVDVDFEKKVAKVFGFVEFDTLSGALRSIGYDTALYDSNVTILSPQSKLLVPDASVSSSSSEVFTPPSSSSSSSSIMKKNQNLEDFAFLVLKVFGMSCASCVRKL